MLGGGGDGRNWGGGTRREGNVGWALTGNAQGLQRLSKLGLGCTLGSPVQTMMLQNRASPKVTDGSSKCPAMGTAENSWAGGGEQLRFSPNR